MLNQSKAAESASSHRFHVLYWIMITVGMQERAFLLLSGKLQEENGQEPQLQLHMQTGSILRDIYMYYNLH